jgi:MFS family permease
MASKVPDLSNAIRPAITAVTGSPSQRHQVITRTRGFIIAWGFALIFYFLEYAVRSSPSVMISELSTAFRTTALGVGSILGVYYYTYSTASLVAGATLDRLGAKRSVSAGAMILGLGCLLFGAPAVISGEVGRLLQGAGSAFAFTGAVYLAAHGFSPQRLATAVGVTQCLGMLGGSAGQFAVGPMIEHGLGMKTFWAGVGVLCLINAILLFVVTPTERFGANVGSGGFTGLLKPYKVVFSNPQSYLCGIVSGLLFAPTTVGFMIWGVSAFQKDLGMSYHEAVDAVSLVPLGWVIGCPLLGWLSDRIGRRKPVIAAGAAIMALVSAQALYLPELIPLGVSMLIFGIASGAAMIPYTTIKEVNPDNVKGSATGGMNFLVFAITAVIGPVFANLFGKSIASTANHLEHFREGGLFWIVCCVLALVITFLLRETGHAVRRTAQEA